MRFWSEIPEEKTLLRRPRHGYEENIKMNVTDIWWGCLDWICLAQDRDNWRTIVNTVVELRVNEMLENTGVASRMEISEEELRSCS